MLPSTPSPPTRHLTCVHRTQCPRVAPLRTTYPERGHLMDDAIVLAEGLHKTYGDTQALRGLDLTIRRGSVFGLLGPNGAGKTTAVRVLTTLAQPTGGGASDGSVDATPQPDHARPKMGPPAHHATAVQQRT